MFQWAKFESGKNVNLFSNPVISCLFKNAAVSLKYQQIRKINILTRRIFPIFLFFFFVLFSLPSPLLSQQNKVRVTAARANIYINPDIKSKIVETVEKGALLYLFSTERMKNNWYHIYFYSQKRKTTVVGYIQISMVGEMGEAPKVSEEEKKPEMDIKEVTFEPPKKIKVIAAKANIRAEPDVESQIIQEAQSNTKFQAIGITGEWYIIILPPDKEGIVLSGYIHQNLVEEIVEDITEAPKIEEKKPEVTPPPELRAYKPKRVKTGPRSCIGIGAGYSMPRENNYSDEVYYGGNFCLGISKNLSIELSGLRVQYDVVGSVDGLSNGELSIIPIQLSIQVRFPVTHRFVPYALGGGGYYLNSFALAEEIINTWDALGFDIEEKIENSIGYHFGAGLDLFITGNIVINADFRYCLVKAKGSWSLTDQISGTVTSGNLDNLNINTIMFGAGLKFCF